MTSKGHSICQGEENSRTGSVYQRIECPWQARPGGENWIKLCSHEMQCKTRLWKTLGQPARYTVIHIMFVGMTQVAEGIAGMQR